MSILTASEISITAPASVDGRGEVAVLNNSASGNFVGHLLKPTGFGGAGVRTSIEPIVEGHGAAFGNFFRAHRPFTFEVMLARAATWALSDARHYKLVRAFNAMAEDGTIVWTDTDTIVKRILFRTEQPPSDPDEGGKVILGGVCESDKILSNATPTPTAPGSGLSNVGNTGTLPSFTFTSGASGTVVISRTSPSPTETLTLNIGGTTGLAASTVTTVDFEARTIYQGSTNKMSAEVFPSSVWWEMAPGNNTISVTGATSITVSWRSAWLAG